ncbi:MAG: efflux RND transporter periplasmic adaptor subunit [Deltaproteobacteria bacterium]|nr:efflux RND transporter periplasmic adaptor subunit [Deltaproteobacteria bacterium]
MKQLIIQSLAHRVPTWLIRYAWPVVLFIFLWLPLSSHAQQLSISGFTEPYLDAMLGISATGRVAMIHLAEGTTVEKGQVILELDQQLEKLEVQRRKLLWSSKVEVRSAARQVKTLRSHLKSTKELYRATGSVPREEMENQELQHALAIDELRRLEAAEEREKIEYGIANQQLSRRSLRAPFSGQIAELLINVGENCEFDTPLVHLVNTSRGNFVANVELSVSQKLTRGQTVELQLQSGLKTVSRKAEIVFISPVVDPASGLRKIKAQFDNPDGNIVPGVAGMMILDTGKQ